MQCNSLMSEERKGAIQFTYEHDTLSGSDIQLFFYKVQCLCIQWKVHECRSVGQTEENLAKELNMEIKSAFQA